METNARVDKNMKQKFRYISKSYIAKNNIKYPGNAICNQKYKPYSLFFFVLLQQFKFFFNSYFFCVAFTQCFEIFSITSPFSSMGPWCFVLCISLFKEGYDDYMRHERDRAINNQTYIKYTGKGFKRICSADIEVGDLILLEKNERVPADMALLKTADLSGQLFIRTDQLDGETDWKLKTAVPSTQNTPFQDIVNVSVLAESPHKDIYSFKGNAGLDELSGSFLQTVELEKPKKQKPFQRLLDQIFSRKVSKKENKVGKDDVVDVESVEWVYNTSNSESLNEVNETKEALSDAISSKKTVSNGVKNEQMMINEDVSGSRKRNIDDKTKDINTEESRSKKDLEPHKSFEENLEQDLTKSKSFNQNSDSKNIENQEKDNISTYRTLDGDTLNESKSIHDLESKNNESVDPENNVSKLDDNVEEDDYPSQSKIKTVKVDDETYLAKPIELTSAVEPLSLENMLWMNTVVATCPALGFVVYTGNDTRAMMNTSKPRNKVGLFDLELNMYSKFLGISSALVALFFMYMRGLNESSPFIFVRFLVLFSSVIPISLKVTIDMARYVYAYYITNDSIIKGTIVRNTSLPEELGRVSYFLSDKTGTLTKNEMEMKKLHLGTICYTKDLNDEICNNIIKYLRRVDAQKEVFARGKKDLNTRIYELVQALCVCHNVTPVISSGELAYQASSPDEVAIVKWTELVKMRLYKRDRESITILDPLDDEQVYEILYIFPFTSETKRMGIIVKHQDEILFFMKGADVVMNKIIKSNEWVEEETENMARDGLRTLVIAKKSLLHEEFSQFEKMYSKAKVSLDNRNEKIEQALKFIEKDMSVLGLTGVEDKLQDNVKVTLENLRNGGMKVWMLTGDKIETAISISISSRIFTRTTNFITIANLTSLNEIMSKFRELERSDYDALVVDGTSLTIIMDKCFDEFIDLASKLDAVVGCRFSPTQKALVARNLKNRTKKIVCCIGDGGNDVSMITEANVGIGIVGKEGNQASLAADYSINKFCFVSDLFFWHGRNSYKNSSSIANLIIHRGTILSVLQGLFCAMISFVPFNLFNGVILIAFVTCYTFLPIFSVVTTSDISRNVSYRFPELYKELLENELLSIKEFASWNLMSFYQGTIIMLSFLYFKQELFVFSTLTFSCLIVNEICMVGLTVSKINLKVLASCGISIFLYMFSFIGLKETLYIDSPIYIFIPTVLGVNFLAISLKLIQMLIEYFQPPTYSKLDNNV